MKKKLLTTAIAVVGVAPLAVQAENGPTVYGKVHVSVDHVDFDNAAVTAGSNNKEGEYWRVVSRASRLGVKGSEELGEGLKAIYK